MPRPQQHLADLVEQYGDAAGSRFIKDLLEEGLAKKQEAKDAARAIEKQGQVRNPFVTHALKCKRAIYFYLTEEQETEPLTTDSLVNFAIGHAVEEAFADILGPAVEGKVAREVPVEFSVEGVRVSGRLDFAILVPDARVLIELKAINSRSMGFMLKQQKPGRDEHRRQLNLYLHGSAEKRIPCLTCGGKGFVSQHHDGRYVRDMPCFRCEETCIEPSTFDLGYLLYIVKDATKGEPVFHPFPVKYDKALAEGDLAFLARMAKEHAAVRIDPGIPEGYEKRKFPCSYCSFKTRCWG